jgi:hypothetical protein
MYWMRTAAAHFRWVAWVIFCLFVPSLAGHALAVASTGVIEGQVSMGPMTAAQRPGAGAEVPTVPLHITVLNDAGNNVAQVISDARGHFTIELPAGVYVLRPEKPPGPGRALPKTVTLGPNSVAAVTIEYDTGIR